MSFRIRTLLLVCVAAASPALTPKSTRAEQRPSIDLRSTPAVGLGLAPIKPTPAPVQAQQPADSPRVARLGETPASPPAKPETKQAEIESSDVSATESESASPDSVAPTLLTAERIDALLQACKANDQHSDELRAKIEKQLNAALDWIHRGDACRQKSAVFKTDIETAEKRIEQARAELSTNLPPPAAVLPTALPELETLLLTAESREKKAVADLEQRESELKGRAERKTELAQKITEVKQRIENATAELASEPPADEPAELIVARRSELQLRVATSEAQLEQLKLELKRLDSLADLFPLSRDLAKREVKAARAALTQLQQLTTAARTQESKKQADAAIKQAAASKAEIADPAIDALAQHNTELAERRKKLTADITRIESERVGISKQRERLKQEYQRSMDRAAKAGRSTTVAVMLRRQRESLPNVEASKRRLEFVAKQTPELSLALMDLEEERSELSEPTVALDRVVMKLAPETKSLNERELKDTIRELLVTQNSLLSAMLTDLDRHLFGLSELEMEHQQLIVQTREFQSFIDENVLWIRSSARLSTKSFTDAVEGLQQLAMPQAWWKLAASYATDASSEPLLAVGTAVFVLLLLLGQSHLKHQIRELCSVKSNTAGVRFAPSVQAIVLSLVVTAEWPLVIWYFGWRLGSADPLTELGGAIGPAMQYAAPVLWVSGFLQAICRRDGVAANYFGWFPSGLVVARRALRWLTLTALPLATLVVASKYFQEGIWEDSMGRLAFITIMLLLIVFTHLTLGSKNHIFREAVARDSGSWLHRVRIASYLVGVGISLSLTILALIGYHYSASQLALRFQGTMILCFGCLLLHAVAARWFVVKRRRLAVAQAKSRQQETGEQADPSNLNSPIVIDDSPDWNVIHDRLRMLLRQAITVCLLFGVWTIWSDVLPALKILDRVELWSHVVEVEEPQFDASNQPLPPSSRSVHVATTLRHGIIAVLTLLATFFLGKNLPALLEITILNRLPLDRGGRHATCVILHYTVALTGMLVACSTMNIHWSSVQWLAAGVTVGLGFGLQEIFANFVSGMILLFERPIRVGDVITLGDVTGTVTNIRIRATTVTNWDRKELIVPNKDLITGRLLNWTLSDTTNRLVIQLGIAYASDTEIAREIMLRVVSSHENVSTISPPIVTFESFGDSTLNFVIRAYLASLDVRLETVHQLNVQLHRELQSAGIEIAFPQRDINVRHVNWPQMANPATNAAHGHDETRIRNVRNADVDDEQRSSEAA